MSESSHARRLGFKLFLEGIEVDMVNCKITGGLNRPASASISIPSNDYAHLLKPRTLVHIFFFENRYELGTEPIRYKNGELGNKREVKLEERNKKKKSSKASMLHDYEDIMNWKLLFSGEVIGYGFSKIGGIRSISLSCQDFSSYWDAAKMYWGYPGASQDSKKRAIFVGATRLYQGGKKRVTTRDRLVQVLTAKPNGQLQPEGILGGLVSLLESASGVFSPGENGKKHRGVNDMLSYAENKYHLTRTIAASDKDRTASIFLNDALFKKWLYRVGRSVKQTASYLQLVTSILPHIHYEWSSILAPPYVPAQKNMISTTIKTIPTKYKGGDDVSELVRRCTFTWKAINVLESKTIRNSSHRSSMPWGYDFMSHEPGTTDGEQNKNTETNKMVEVDLWKGSNHITSWGNASEIRQKGTTVRNSMYKKAKGSSKVKRRADQLLRAFDMAASAVTILARMRDAKLKRTSNNFFDAKYLLEQAMELASGGLVKPTKTDKSKVDANSRLHMFMFKPDLYMSPPPKCNVLFPDMIQSILYSRNWMSEVSRLWLFTRWSSGRSMSNMYFAPNTSVLGKKDTDSKQYKSSAEEAVRQRESFHMEHERFTGIIPKFEAISDWRAMKKAYKKQLAEGGEAGKENNPHLVRAANFLFFKNRFSTRNIQLTLRFSPQLIAGLPALVLDPEENSDRFVLSDKPEDENTVQKKFSGESIPEKKSTGTHYFGVVQSVVHIANASGGAQTKVVLSHCRTHTEAADIYGGEKISSWTYKTVTSTKLKGGNYKAELMAEFMGADVYDENFKDILGSEYKSNATYVAEVQKDSSGNNAYTHFDPYYISKTDTPADKPQDHPMAEKAGKVGDDDDSPEYRVPAVQLKVWEVTKRRRATNLNYTFESIVTPPWYSGCFLPHKIGQEFYEDMVGCGSVLDDPPIALTPEGSALYEDILKAEDSSTEATFLQIQNKFPIHNYATGDTDQNSVYVPKELLKKSNSATYAAEYLAEAWLGLKRLNTDINAFIDTYVDRSYATMLDIFGNQNKDAYTGVKHLGKKGRYNEGEFKLKDPVKGFHENAFGDKEKLDGFPDAATERLPKSDSTSKERKGINPLIDTRKEKFKAVMDYRGSMLRGITDKTSKK